LLMRIGQVREIAVAGENTPPKSTFFPRSCSRARW
jgi:hypothetical protein